MQPATRRAATARAGLREDPAWTDLEGSRPVRDRSSRLRAVLPIAAVGASIVAAAALLASIGADSRWLAALGREISASGSIPSGVPFAAAPTHGWANGIVLAQLTFHALESTLGDRGLMLAQLVAVAFALTALARDALAGGALPRAVALSLGLACLGAVSSLVIVRVQLFSLALFPLLVALLRSEARRPSRRIWLALPLLALWSNLHGAALIGLAVTLVYLIVHRLREEPWTALVLILAAPMALCLTPAGLSTIAYYHGVLTNAAAARGEGLWAPLSPSDPLDAVMIAIAVVLCARLYRCRPRRWEFATIALLAILTVQTGRSGVWLLFFLVAPAARTFRLRSTSQRLLPAIATVAAGTVILAVARGPLPRGAGRPLIEQAISLAHGHPVLAEDILAEQVALAGGRVWIGNPIDAFTKPDQRAYLDWLDGRAGSMRPYTPHVRVVLTLRAGAAERLMEHTPGFVRLSSDRRAELFIKSG